jgi:hypothetical protein
MTVEMTFLCPKPDRKGVFNPRCKHVIEEPEDEATPRQCRAAAQRGTDFCIAHQTTEAAT